jgi:hypothetical protein
MSRFPNARIPSDASKFWRPRSSACRCGKKYSWIAVGCEQSARDNGDVGATYLARHDALLSCKGSGFSAATVHSRTFAASVASRTISRSIQLLAHNVHLRLGYRRQGLPASLLGPNPHNPDADDLPIHSSTMGSATLLCLKALG